MCSTEPCKALEISKNDYKTVLNTHLTLIHASLELKYHREEFLEYCTENDVQPDIDMLRSWLIERCIADDAANSIQFRCPNSDCGFMSDLN